MEVMKGPRKLYIFHSCDLCGFCWTLVITCAVRECILPTTASRENRTLTACFVNCRLLDALCDSLHVNSPFPAI
jgi:hypothetical protein